MRAIVYVEGPSDVQGLQALFRDLLSAKADRGVGIDFVPSAKGDRKEWLLVQAPLRAVNILRNDPDARVAIVPDFTPPNKAFPHDTPDEMIAGIYERFDRVLSEKGISDTRLRDRFRAFCFEYEFEVLLLAAQEQLCAFVGCDASSCHWTRLPEDHNHGDPPKDVVIRLFRAQNRHFQPILSAAEILDRADYKQIEQTCPQHFAPFAQWLESL